MTGEIPKLQKFTGEHQQFKISLGETQITNTHRRGRKSKPFLLGTDFIGLIFTGELSGVDSARELRQGVLFICNQKYRKAVSYKIAVKVVLLGIAAFKIYLLLWLTVKNLCVHLRKQSSIGFYLNNCFESFTKTLKNNCNSLDNWSSLEKFSKSFLKIN